MASTIRTLCAAAMMLAGGCNGSAATSQTSRSSESDSAGPTGRDPTSGDATTQTSSVDAGESGTTTDDAVTGCAGTALLSNPADPSQRGPWPVGVRTVDIEGLVVEVWYPAVLGSEVGVSPEVYDIRLAIPESERTKISDEDNPWQPCDCSRDLPVDTSHGPYPVVVFVHGTASFRTQSLPQMVHWASRGFVVIAADHPGLWLADLLGGVCGEAMVGQHLEDDVETLLAAVRGEVQGLADLAGVIDAERIGMAGHSAGGGTIASFGDDARVLVSLASRGVSPGTTLDSVLVMGGTDDAVVDYGQQQQGFADSPAPKRLVGIAAGGHLSFSEICSLHNAAGENLLKVATDAGVCGAQLAGVLFQCSDALIADPDAWSIVNFATAAAFEETLQCSSIGTRFGQLDGRPGVAELVQE